MYSTDDDLFAQRRTQKKWQRPTEKNTRERPVACVEDKRRAEASDESSDDFANERDPIWMRQRKREEGRVATSPPCRAGGVESKRGGKEFVAVVSSDSSDFEFVKRKGKAFVDRKGKEEKEPRVEIKRKAELEKKREMPQRQASSSCAVSTCEQIAQEPRHTTHKLLERHARRPFPSKGAAKQRENPSPDFRKEKNGSVDSALLRISEQLRDDMQSLSRLLEQCKEGMESDNKQTDLAEQVKEFIGRQLRKGIDKAVASAVIKLNERVRSEAEVSNEKMELLMNGLMDSYGLISNKVQDMTDAYRELGAKLQTTPQEGIRSRSCSRSRRCDSRADGRTRRSDSPRVSWRDSSRERTGKTNQEPTAERHPPQAASHSNLSRSKRRTSTPSAPPSGEQNVEVSELRRALDDLEEKTNQCWFEIANVRAAQNKRNQRTRHQVRQLTEDVAQNQSAAQCKDKFIAGQVSDLSKHLTAIAESLAAVEKARTKADHKTSEVEAYVSQIYEACKTTLKSVDVRYQKLKEYYKEVRDKNFTTDKKCEALGESLSNLYRKTKQKT